ncbi:MAG TPA: cell division ATP-binding protein FtsE [Clostridia bacterium]|nr:cell division ATP-binding protein FtsE [Clostridia bacterium]
MIEFNNVSKTYANGTHALKNVNIKINQGEFAFVVGASGAGKSTFLKLMMREEVPSSGSITMNNYNLSELENKKIPYFRRTLGVVFQDFRLIPNMTVYDNVAFAMRVIGAKEKKIRKRVPYVISLVGLATKARCYPNELSGGEQQRVALARALANNAELIIADEPTGNVDPQMSYEIVDLLTRLNDAGTTVIMVTHEHNLVKRFNRRVIILEQGCVVYDGTSLTKKNVKSSQGHISHDMMPESKNEKFELRETSTVTPEEEAGDVK